MTTCAVIFKYRNLRCHRIFLSRENRKGLFSQSSWENRKVEHALASVLTEFRARRNFAISVRRHEKIDGCLYAQNHRHATRDAERVVAYVRASRRRHIDGCRNVWRNYATRRHAHDNVKRDADRARARALHAVCVGVGNLNRYRNRGGNS